MSQYVEVKVQCTAFTAEKLAEAKRNGREVKAQFGITTPDDQRNFSLLLTQAQARDLEKCREKGTPLRKSFSLSRDQVQRLDLDTPVGKAPRVIKGKTIPDPSANSTHGEPKETTLVPNLVSAGLVVVNTPTLDKKLAPKTEGVTVATPPAQGAGQDGGRLMSDREAYIEKKLRGGALYM